MELKNTLKNMALNSIKQDLNLLAEKIRDSDLAFLGLTENQQKDFKWIHWACLKGIEKIESIRNGGQNG